MIRPLIRVSPEAAGISSQRIRNMVRALEKSGNQMHGLMISRGKQVLFETWWAPYGPDLIHSNQSLGKTYMGTALGKAYTDGLVRLDERVTDIFAEEIRNHDLKPDANMEKMTVRDLLCMATGMTECPALGGEDFVLDFLLHPVTYAPGEHFFYNTAGSSLLAAIVEKKTGRPLKEYMAEKVFSPIGLDSKRMRWLRFKNGVYAEPGVLTTTEDNLRLAMLYLQSGEWEGQQILARDYVKMATALQNPSWEDQGIADCKCGYGFMMWRCSVPGVYRFDGGLGQYCIVRPDQQLIVAIHETACYPDGVQKTLDIIYDYLMREDWLIQVEEDPAAEAALKAVGRSRKLSIPTVDCAKWQTLNGTYHLTSGLIDPWPVMFREFRKEEMVPFLRTCHIQWHEDSLDIRFDESVHFCFGFDGEADISQTINVIPELDLAYGYVLKADEKHLVLRSGWLQSCFYMNWILEKTENDLVITWEKPWMQSDGKLEAGRAVWIRENHL